MRLCCVLFSALVTLSVITSSRFFVFSGSLRRRLQEVEANVQLFLREEHSSPRRPTTTPTNGDDDNDYNDDRPPERPNNARQSSTRPTARPSQSPTRVLNHPTFGPTNAPSFIPPSTSSASTSSTSLVDSNSFVIIIPIVGALVTLIGFGSIIRKYFRLRSSTVASSDVISPAIAVLNHRLETHLVGIASAAVCDDIEDSKIAISKYKLPTAVLTDDEDTNSSNAAEENDRLESGATELIYSAGTAFRPLAGSAPYTDVSVINEAVVVGALEVEELV